MVWFLNYFFRVKSNNYSVSYTRHSELTYLYGLLNLLKYSQDTETSLFIHRIAKSWWMKDESTNRMTVEQLNLIEKDRSQSLSCPVQPVNEWVECYPNQSQTEDEKTRRNNAIIIIIFPFLNRKHSLCLY